MFFNKLLFFIKKLPFNWEVSKMFSLNKVGFLIPPIENNNYFLNKTQPTSTKISKSPVYIAAPTQLEKSSKNSIFNCLKSIPFKILNFLFSFFSFITCGYFFAKKEISLKVLPKLNQQSLQKIKLALQTPAHDLESAFQKEIYQKDEKGNIVLKHLDRANKIFSLYSILGSGGATHWKLNQTQLFKLKEEIKSIDFKPFESLYYMLYNEEILILIKNIKTSFLSNYPDYLAIKLSGQKHPWEQIKEKQAAAFEKKYIKDPKYFETLIPGFCHLLYLNKQSIQSFVLQKKWKDLVTYILDCKTKNLS